MTTDLVEQALVRCLRPASPLFGIVNRADAAPIPWEEVAERAVTLRLAPLLYLSTRSGAGTGPPAGVALRLRREYLQTTLANTILAREAASLLARFEREGIPLILLKGIALAHSLYADSAARALGDIDLLVRPEDQARARALLLGAGYAVAPDLSDRFRDEFESEQVFRRTTEPKIMVDLHRHLFNVPKLRRTISMEWYWERTEPVRVEGREGRMLGAAPQLLHLAGHYAFHHRTEGLRWQYDLVLLLARDGAPFPWEEALRAAKETGLSAAVEYALAKLERVWGLTFPPEARAALDRFSPTEGERLAFASLTAPQNRARVLWDAFSMPGWRGKLVYLSKSIAPDKDYMMQRYEISDGRLLPFYYVGRLAYGSWLVARSVGSMAANVGRQIVRTTRSDSGR